VSAPRIKVRVVAPIDVDAVLLFIIKYEDGCSYTLCADGMWSQFAPFEQLQPMHVFKGIAIESVMDPNQELADDLAEKIAEKLGIHGDRP
jgi:hypothetical protein